MQGCDNVSKIEFEGLNFQGAIGQIIVDEFHKCQEEFKDQLSLAPCDIRLTLVSDLMRAWYDIRDMKEDLSHVRLYKYFNEESSATHPMFQTEFGGYREDDIVIVNALNILIFEDRINDYITTHLDNLDIVVKIIQKGVRHEVGHVIDFIRYHKMNFDKYRAERDIREEARIKYHEEIQDDGSIDDLRKYYELEEEAVANANVGISLEEAIKYDIMLSKIDHSKLKTTITITSTHEPIKDGDEDEK